MRRATWLVIGLLGACGKGGATSQEQLPAYLAGDVCHGRADSAACAADARCQWFALGIACRVGEPCVSGVCQERDPCAALDEAACAADAACMWAGAVAALCPPGAKCLDGGGFCTRRPADGCACACPVYCPEGKDCPPCACDCSGGGGAGGGGTCACACAPCPPGAPCPACSCGCEPPPPTCGTTGGTCTCACPACAPGETCPPCSCDCGAATGGTAGATPACTTSCPDCAPNQPCPPCESTCPPADAGTAPAPCTEHTDEKSCLEDTANRCAWAAILAPCREGEPCPAGACYARPPDACACACPACAPDSDCPPCQCDCPPPMICP